MQFPALQQLLLLSQNFSRYDPIDATMRFSSSLVAGLASLAAAAPSELASRDLNSFVEQERAISLQGVKNNIGASGSKAQGAGAGFVVASPSKTDPDCMFSLTDIQWEERRG